MNKINWQERINQLLSTGRNKSYFTVGFTILFVVVMSIIGVIPAISSLGVQNEDNKKRDLLIANLEKKLNDLKSLTLEEESQKELVDYFNVIMPEGEAQEASIDLINSMASKRGLKVNSFVFDNESRELLDNVKINYGETVTAMYVSIFVEGDRDNVMNFLRDVESSARILDIRDFTMERVLNRTSSEVSFTGIKYKLNLKLIIFNYK